MSKIVVNNSWPESLPLPFVDFSGSPRDTTLTSPETDPAKIRRRSRYTKNYHSLPVKWVFTTAEYNTFKSFFKNTLRASSAFSIELRFPKNSALSEWIARFISDGFEATPEEGMWVVDALLDLVFKQELGTGFGPFRVVVEGESGHSQPFYTLSQKPFYVTTGDE